MGINKWNRGMNKDYVQKVEAQRRAKVEQEQQSLQLPIQEKNKRRIVEIDNTIINLEDEIKAINEVNLKRIEQLKQEKAYLEKQIPKVETLLENIIPPVNTGGDKIIGEVKEEVKPLEELGSHFDDTPPKSKRVVRKGEPDDKKE